MTRLLTSICLSVMLALPSMTLPAAAQTTTDGCMSIEAVMDNLANTPAEDRQGVSLIIMADQPATDFLAEAVRMFGPPPGRDVAKVETLLVIRKEGNGALVKLVEGIEACSPDLMLSETSYQKIMTALKGITI